MTEPLSSADRTAMHASPELPDVPVWLDDVEGDEALAWVEERNAETRAEYEDDSAFIGLRDDVEAILDSPDKIPAVSEAAGMLYNLWTDGEHPHGLWRRTTWESYRAGAPAATGPAGADASSSVGTSTNDAGGNTDTATGTQWDLLLDLDALGEAEDTTWVWHGAEVLRDGPLAGRRALVNLSEGGSDTDVTRELDFETHTFLSPTDSGFYRAPSKGRMSWADDEGDTVLVTGDLGEGLTTTSGYPREVLRRRRGERVEDAELLIVAPTSAVAAYSWRDEEGRTWVGYSPDFYTEEQWLVPDGAATLAPADAATADPATALVAPGAIHVDVPGSAQCFGFRDHLIVQLRDEWEIGGTVHPAGAVLAAPLDAFLAGEAALTALFTPTRTAFVQGVTGTRHHLLLALLDDVLDRFEVLTPTDDGGWERRELDLGAVTAKTELGGTDVKAHAAARATADAPVDDAAAADEDPTLLRPGRAILAAHVGAVDPEVDDRIWFTASTFTEPTTLAVLDLGEDGTGSDAEVLRQAPARFDSSGVVTTQHVAVSEDGTRVPYFQVGRPGTERADGGHEPVQVLLNAYGGFEVPETVTYLGATGRAWVEEGGTYVLANIRGGGEYGPAWHRAGLKENRHRVYEDLAAVARALTERGVTTPERLGVMGGSNGGLLVGNMLTQYPELFGAVVCEVPLLDMSRYTHLLAGASWAAEYGDPDDPEQWEFIKGFSPFHLLREGTTYPPVLLITSTRDDRVHPAHARTMAHRMLSLGQDVTYFENSEGGHGRASTNAQRAFMVALEHEFLRRHLER